LSLHPSYANRENDGLNSIGSLLVGGIAASKVLTD